MDPKTSAALSSVTPNYRSGHRQTIPIDDEHHLADMPPSYEASVTPAHTATNTNTPPTSAPAASARPVTSASLASSSTGSSAHSGARLQPGSDEQYTSPKPMNPWYHMDEEARQVLENSPGCCFSTRGGCCFSDMGGCCFSSNSGCFFSDNSGCCCSDHGGAFCSDHGGAFCSDPGPGRNNS